MNKIIFYLSITLNIGLITIFYIRGLYPSINKQEKNKLYDCVERMSFQSSIIGRDVSYLRLINSKDTIDIKEVTKKLGKLFFLTGYESCDSCLERELNRIKSKSHDQIIVLGNFDLEAELRFYWRKHELRNPLFFIDYKNLNFNEIILMQPSYMKIGSDGQILNFLITNKKDELWYVDEFLDNIEVN